MELYSEIPDHRDSNGNKNRSIYKHPSPDRLPEIRQDSMFFLLCTELELRTSSHIFAEKMRDFGKTAETIFNAILRREAPEGWRCQEIILPTLQGDRKIYLFRSGRPEQVIVLANDIEDILRGQQFFEQGKAVSTMLQKFQVAVFLYAKRIVNTLVNTEVDSIQAANLLKRTADRFKKNWELCRLYFDRQGDWHEVENLARIAVEHAESERSYFTTQTPSPPPITINAQRDVNMAGRDMHHHNPNSSGDSWIKGLAIAIIAGLTVAFVTWKMGWVG